MCFCWNHGNPHAWDELPKGITDANSQHDEMVKHVATMLSESASLHNLHLSIPRLDSAIPFAVPRLSSLTIPVTGCLHKNPDFSQLLKLFQIQTVKSVEIVSMLRLNCPVPLDCHQPGTSNVTRLAFTDCGPLSEEVADLLRWPTDLQVLHFSVAIADGLNRYAYDSGNGSLTMSKILGTVTAVQRSLQDLYIGISHSDVFSDLEPLQEEAFQSFSKLRRLNIPLAMLMQFSDEYSLTHEDKNPPIHTCLPFSLEELVLHVEVDFPWFQVLDDEEETCAPSSEARELFEWLSGLARHKANYFPHLFEVQIVRNAQDWLTPETHPYDFPLNCQYTRQFVGMLQSADVSILFA